MIRISALPGDVMMTARYAVFTLTLFALSLVLSGAAQADAMRCSSLYACCVAACRQPANAAVRPICIANCGQHRGACLRSGCWIDGAQKICSLARR
jgi:hypothetical protein